MQKGGAHENARKIGQSWITTSSSRQRSLTWWVEPRCTWRSFPERERAGASVWWLMMRQTKTREKGCIYTDLEITDKQQTCLDSLVYGLRVLIR
jgi:hypothetical protein